MWDKQRAVTDFESRNIEFTVVGIGLNHMPEDGFLKGEYTGSNRHYLWE